ncbi:phosphorothioated DNA-binding restriction endonuclease [Halobacillus massiliensis]|uniref:phosphorothioated DNA-binding restriction endonuclease n=1 Tax=Halobacillus massiliensis TaxID=1926286 RepID=UPI0009E51336|nr:HNH endonuclease [Halobacillus massiliensis]
MNINQFRRRVEQITIWKKYDQRAPHKPLLILYALGKLHTYKQTAIPFSEADSDLKALLIEFGPPRKSQHPEQPFVRLPNDGIWTLSTSVDYKSTNYSKVRRELLDNQITGGFTPEVQALLEKDKNLIFDTAQQILEEHFPTTLHDDLLEAVSLNKAYKLSRKRRDPEFRKRILEAYEERCAICGFNAKIHNRLVGIEAAHIKWHQFNGPDVEENGLALCSLHHKLFDQGIMTVTNEHLILVSSHATGFGTFEDLVTSFHMHKARNPVSSLYQPSQDYTDWHIREVYKG